MIRKNADGSISVGMLEDETPKQEKSPVETDEVKKPRAKRKPRTTE